MSSVGESMPLRDERPSPPSTQSRVGSWIFRQRSWLPVPLALVLIFVRRGEVTAPWVLVSGGLVVLGGQVLRLWGVRHIGAISRTRANRYGPFISAGPYALVRNPLYVGNWLLWTGLVIMSGLLWMLPIAWALFALQYGAIVHWEEECLRVQFADDYARYCRDVPRWLPQPRLLSHAFDAAPAHSWRQVAFSERGTLLAVALLTALLLVKRSMS